MRLTLRTMLAYLDDVLQPSDAVELGRRIEESKFATDLTERIRTATRRARLEAPKVVGRGIGLDANSVAEYLDSTLPAERVSDFEKVCLESDVHLAEVACCHQILTRVLAGENPSIPAGLRERMLELGSGSVTAPVHRKSAKSRKAAADVAGGTLGTDAYDTADVTAPPVAAGRAATAGEPAVPATAGPAEPSGLPWLGMALALGAAFLLVVGGLRLLGPFDSRHPLAAWLGGRQVAVLPDSERDAAARDDSAASKARAATSTPAAQDGRTATDMEALAANDARPVDEQQTPTDGGRSHANTDVPASDQPRDRAAADSGAAPGEPARGDEPTTGPPNRRASVASGKPTERSEEPSDVPALRKDVPPPKPSGVAAELAESANAGKPAPAAGSVARSEPSGAGTPEAATKGRTKAKSGSTKAAKEVEPPPAEIARLVSEDQVVASIEPRDGLWYRLSRGTSLVAGKTYVALPMYRPQILAANSTQIMFVGPAAFTMIESAGDDLGGGISLDRGRAILVSAGKPGVRVPVALAGLRGWVVFGEPNAELAVEVRRFLPPGADPADEPAEVTRLFYTRRGSVEWQPAEGAPIRIPADQVLALAEEEEPIVEPATFPTWAEIRNVSKLDRDAYEQLESFLSPDRPLTLSLEERTDFRKTEIRSLAARSLGALGEYEALIRELSNEQQHSYWDRTVDELRDALARGPEQADKIRDTLRRIRIEETDLILRLLRDYSPEQLERQGGAAELVGYLDHKSLDVRVLAFETLRRITGVTLYYRPEAPAERRRVPLQKWRERLRDGLIVYKTPPGPAPILERKGTAKP